MEEKKLVKKIHSRLDKSKKHKAANYQSVWKELDEFYRGDQYKSTKLPPWVPKPVTNFIHLVVTTKRAALSGENPMAMLRPQSADDIEPVNTLQIVYEWVWKRIKARNVMRDCIETSKLLGTAIAYVYWDENTGVLGGTNAAYEGEIRIKEIDPMNFHVDPNAYSIQEAEWVHVTEKRSRSWVESEFGVSLSKTETDSDNFGENYNRDYFKVPEEKEDKEGMIDFHAHFERYWNTEKMPPLDQAKMGKGPMDDSAAPEGGMPTSPEMSMGEDGMPDLSALLGGGGSEPSVPDAPPGTADNPVLENGVDPMMIDPDDAEEIGGWKYKVTYMAGNKILDTVDPIEPNMYPFAVLYDFKQRQEFWGRGTASLILENQKLVNKVESIVAMIGTLLQNPQRVVSKQSGINPREAMKYSFAPGHVWVTNGQDPTRAMHWQSPPDIPSALMNLAEQAKENIREITGLNEAYMGQSVGSLQTSGGVNSLIDRATMRDKDQMYDLEQFVEQITRIVLGFVTTKYTEERFIRLATDTTKQESPQPEDFVPFIGTDFADIEYDLDIDVSAQAPVTQARREAEMDQLFTNQYQFNVTPRLITPQEYVKKKRMVDAREIIERMDNEERQSEVDILTQVASMIADAMQDPNVPMDEIMNMARKQIEQIKSGQIPLDPNQPSPVGNQAPTPSSPII